jgi:NADH-quinone oxidoreductase subunit L
MAFHGQPRDQHLYDAAHENKPVMTVPLMILAVLSLVGGFLGLPAALGLPNWIEGWLEPVYHAEHHTAAGLEIALIIVSSVVAIAGIGLAYAIYIRNPKTAESTAQSFSGFYKVLAQKYYIDEIYDALFVNPGKRLSRFLAGIIDVGLIDNILVDGSAKFVGIVGRMLTGLQTGYLRNYIMSIFIGSVILGIYFFLR